MFRPTVIYPDQVVYVDSNLRTHTPETVLTENILALAKKACPVFDVDYHLPPSVGMTQNQRYVFCHTAEADIVCNFNTPEEAEAFARAARVAFLAYRESVYEDALLDLICA